jgi:hypothetical protein
MRSQEYDEGVAAYLAGKPIEANPYEDHAWSGSHNDWCRGWLYAAAMAQEMTQ